MIINNSNEFIFVHIPKTAGTSVTSVLSRFTTYRDIELGGTPFGERIQPAYYQRFGLSKHSPASVIKSVVGDVVWSKYFTFSFVRNPFSRCLSTYYFLRKWESPNRAFTERIRAFRSFREYILSGILDELSGPDDIFRPQCHWLREKAPPHRMLVDYVGRVEDLEASLSHCLEVIGVRKMVGAAVDVPKLNRSEDPANTDLDDKEVVERIITKYKADFDMFSYSLEPPGSSA